MTREKGTRVLAFLMVMIPALLMGGCSTTTKEAEKDLTVYVDPMIGSGGHGHVFVGASVPFGMVQLGPTNPTQGWDWCSGYHHSDSLLMGFTHTHLSGTGIGDLCDILIMPVDAQWDEKTPSQYYQNWSATYTHADEVAQAGYYSVNLRQLGVSAQMTTTERVGFHKYNFSKEGNSFLIIDMIAGTGWDRFTDGAISQVGDRAIEGFRFSKGWAVDQRLFYHTEFSKPIVSIRYIKNDILKEKYGKENQTAIIEFEGNGELMVKTALSPTSSASALQNLTAELNHWDFEKVKADAQNLWNKELNKIKIESKDPKVMRTFYTALYHSMILPSLYNNADGSFLGTDKKESSNPGFDNYTVFSLWDTYRAAHPLFTITQPERINDLINTMLTIYQHQGKLPVWHLMGCETNTMVGYHAVPVIVDAYFKGYRGYDINLAYEAVKASAMNDEFGVNYLKELGFIPAEKEIESVAKAMEYAIDDWCIAQMAKALGHNDDHDYFMKRAKAYNHYFDPVTRFMRGKLTNGQWREPFSPFHSSHRDDDYCEGNGWQYLWLVPQDVEGLITLLGGDKPFTSKLDSLFTVDSALEGDASPDISGLIGQYAHGNEPSHHTIYLYAFAGEQWKSAEKARQVLSELYFDEPNGLSGNEDAGQMSAWYLLSSMGMYPVNPSAGIYVFGSPAVDKAEIAVNGGKSFTVKASNNSNANIYIQSVTLNGKPYTKSYIKHSDIMKGGELVFEMGSTPNKEFGARAEDRPQSMIYN
jgi:predicted alpha-1,2-mannosidase